MLRHSSKTRGFIACTAGRRGSTQVKVKVGQLKITVRSIKRIKVKNGTTENEIAGTGTRSSPPKRDSPRSGSGVFNFNVCLLKILNCEFL